MNTEQASKVLAKACGVTIEHSMQWKLNDRGDGLPHYHCYGWTIDDARCREVVRDRFGIDTERTYIYTGGEIEYIRTPYGYQACTSKHPDDRPMFIGIGKTIAEAEKACMIKIADNLEEKANETMR